MSPINAQSAMRRAKNKKRKQRLKERKQLFIKYCNPESISLRLQALGACVPENFSFGNIEQFSKIAFHQPLFLRNVAYRGRDQVCTELLTGLCEIMEQRLDMYLHDREQFYTRLYEEYFRLGNFVSNNQLLWRGTEITAKELEPYCSLCAEHDIYTDLGDECRHRYLCIGDYFDSGFQEDGLVQSFCLVVRLRKDGTFGKTQRIFMYVNPPDINPMWFELQELLWLFYHLWTWDELVAFIDSEMQTYGKLSTYLFDYDGSVIRREPYVAQPNPQSWIVSGAKAREVYLDPEEDYEKIWNEFEKACADNCHLYHVERPEDDELFAAKFRELRKHRRENIEEYIPF